MQPCALQDCQAPSQPDGSQRPLNAPRDVQPAVQHEATIPSTVPSSRADRRGAARVRTKRARKLTDFLGFASEGRRVPTRLLPWNCGVCTFENKVCTRVQVRAS